MTDRVAICEGCGNGYPTTAPACIYCGTGAWLSHHAPLQEMVVDVECYVDYLLIKFADRFAAGWDFQMFPGYPLDIDGLRRALTTHRLITFNGTHYDVPINYKH